MAAATTCAVDRRSLHRCLQLARQAFVLGEVPVGALVRAPGARLLSARANAARAGSLRHAELLALADAQAALGAPRLDGCTLYVSLEPCLMCLGAAAASRVARVVFAARSAKYGAFTAGGLALDEGAAGGGGGGACAACAAAPRPRLFRASPVHLRVECAEDAPLLRGLAEQSAALLGEFFRARRGARGALA